MDKRTFDKLLDERLGKIVEILGEKEKEYSSSFDRFDNFKDIARETTIPPEEIAFILMLKHFQGIKDIALNKFSVIKVDRLTKDLISEKIGDIINYLILIEGLLYEKYNLK